MIKTNTPKFEAWYQEEEPNERSAYWVVEFNDGNGRYTTIQKIYSGDRLNTRAQEMANALNKQAGLN